MSSKEIFKGSLFPKTKGPDPSQWTATFHTAGGPPGPKITIAAVLVALSIGIVATWFLNSGSARSVLFEILGLASAAGISIAAVCTRRHKEWLLVPLVLIEANLGGLLEGTTRSAVHYGLLTLFCLPCIPDAWRSNLWRKGAFKLYLIYYGWALITISWSLAPSFSMVRLAGSLLAFCAITSIVANLRDGNDVSRLAWRFLEACGFLVIVVALSAILLPHSMTWSNPTELSLEGEISRFQGIFDNPNAVGALMLDTVTPILAFWAFFGRGQKVFLALVMVLALGTGALADSRSPFVAVGVGCLFYILWRYRSKGLIILIGLTVLVIASLPLFGGYIGEYIAGRDVGTLTGRTEIWAFALRELHERPIRGYGYEVAGAIFQSRYFTEWYGPWDEGPQSSLHNGYLTQAVGVGIPAAIFWLYTLLRPFLFLFSRKEDPWNLKPVFLLVLIPILTLNLTEASLENFLGFDGILFGLIWGAAEMYRRTVVEKEEAAQEKTFGKAPFLSW